jgi:NAD(P)-dependent dehydrogenase (short-subunit alcohol dehydrogenase family)
LRKAEAVLVTGASRGIGAEVARQLVQQSSGLLRLVLAARSEAALTALADELGSGAAAGVELQILPVVMDVSSEESVARAMERVRAEVGEIEAAVLNAGIAESAPLERTSDEMLGRLMNVNVFGVLRLLRELLPAMKAAGYGRIAVLASMAGKVGFRYVSAYCATKHAVLGLVRSAALEVADRGVTINAVCPGFVDTPMTTRSVEQIHRMTGQSKEQVLETLRGASPQHRLFESAEIAAAVQYLLSDEARGVNGATIDIDGGAVGR